MPWSRPLHVGAVSPPAPALSQASGPLAGLSGGWPHCVGEKLGLLPAARQSPGQPRRKGRGRPWPGLPPGKEAAPPGWRLWGVPAAAPRLPGSCGGAWPWPSSREGALSGSRLRDRAETSPVWGLGRRSQPGSSRGLWGLRGVHRNNALCHCTFGGSQDPHLRPSREHGPSARCVMGYGGRGRETPGPRSSSLGSGWVWRGRPPACHPSWPQAWEQRAHQGPGVWVGQAFAGPSPWSCWLHTASSAKPTVPGARRCDLSKQGRPRACW